MTGCPGLYFCPQGIYATNGHFLLIDSLPSASPLVPSSEILLATRHFPTDSRCPIFPSQLPFPPSSPQRPPFPHLPLTTPSAFIVSSDLPHSLPRPHFSSQITSVVSPQNVNSLGQPSPFYPHSPQPCTALCFTLPDLNSYPSFLLSLLTLPSRAFVPHRRLLHPQLLHSCSASSPPAPKVGSTPRATYTEPSLVEVAYTLFFFF